MYVLLCLSGQDKHDAVEEHNRHETAALLAGLKDKETGHVAKNNATIMETVATLGGVSSARACSCVDARCFACLAHGYPDHLPSWATFSKPLCAAGRPHGP